MEITIKNIIDIADIIAGQSPSSKYYNKSGDGLPFFQGKADFGIKYPNPTSWCVNPTKIALENDILMSVRAPVGPVNIANEKSCIGRGISAIRVKHGYDFLYLFYFLKSNQELIQKYSTGSTFKAINQKDIKRIPLPVPKLLIDQKRIAKVLSDCETLILKRKESISLLNELLKSTFLEMFGDPIKNTNGWDFDTIKNHIGEVSTGNTPPRKNPKNYSPAFIEWIKTDNIKGDATYITTATEYLSELGLERARTVKSGALMVACIAGSIDSIGRASLTDREVSFNQQINAIQPNSDVSPLFLYWLFKILKKYIQSHATKGMKKILTKGEFEKIKLIKPPFELQTKFVTIVEKVEELKTQFQESLKELENLYGSLSQRAFSGKLDLSKIEITDMEEKEPKKPEVEPIGEPYQVGKATLQDNIVNIDEIIRNNFPDVSFSFEQLEEAIQNTGVYVQYDAIKDFVFKSLEGESPLLEQIFEEIKGVDAKSKPDSKIMLKLKS